MTKRVLQNNRNNQYRQAPDLFRKLNIANIRKKEKVNRCTTEEIHTSEENPSSVPITPKSPPQISFSVAACQNVSTVPEPSIPCTPLNHGQEYSSEQLSIGPSTSPSNLPVRSSSRNYETNERRNNIQNLVSEIRMRARNRRNNNGERGKSRQRWDTSSPDAEQGQGDTGEGLFHIHSRRGKSNERSNHPNFSNWLNSKSNPFSRNQGNKAEPPPIPTGDDFEITPDHASSPSAEDSHPHSVFGISQTPTGSAVSEFTPNSETSKNNSPSVNFRPQFPRNVTLFATRLFNNDGNRNASGNNNGNQNSNNISSSAGTGGENPATTRDFSSDGGGASQPGSSKLTWTRRLDWKKPGHIIRKVRSYNNLEHNRNGCEEDDDGRRRTIGARESPRSEMESSKKMNNGNGQETLHIANLCEQVRVLRAELGRAEDELRHERIHAERSRTELKVKMEEMTRLNDSLRDTQELQYRNAVEAMNENLKALGSMESSYDYVLSFVGSGRRKTAGQGVWGHVKHLLNCFGDNTIEMFFKITKVMAGIYTTVRRVRNRNNIVAGE